MIYSSIFSKNKRKKKSYHTSEYKDLLRKSAMANKPNVRCQYKHVITSIRKNYNTQSALT